MSKERSPEGVYMPNAADDLKTVLERLLQTVDQRIGCREYPKEVLDAIEVYRKQRLPEAPDFQFKFPDPIPQWLVDLLKKHSCVQAGKV